MRSNILKSITSSVKRHAGTAALLVLALGFSHVALANASLTAGLCNAVGIFTGPIGKFLAVFAVIALGVGMFLGKVTWGVAIAIALGVFAIFGSITIVNKITNGWGTAATGTADVSCS